MKKLGLLLPLFILFTLVNHSLFSTVAQTLLRGTAVPVDFEGYCRAHGYDAVTIQSPWEHHFCVNDSENILVNPHEACFWQFQEPLVNAHYYDDEWVCQPWDGDYYTNEDVKQAWDNAIAAREATCTGRIDNRINVRKQPQRDADVIEVLNPGIDLILQAQTTDLEGKIWWQTGVNQWVREDTVVEQGDCEQIPDILDTPVQVELIAPEEDFITGMRKPEFVWREIPGVFAYAIRVFDPIYYRGAIYSRGNTPETYRCAAGVCRFQPNILLPYDTEYDWSIEAVTIYGSSYSEWRHFALPFDGPITRQDYLGTPFPNATSYPAG